jgi:hypothetical protein
MDEKKKRSNTTTGSTSLSCVPLPQSLQLRPRPCIWAHNYIDSSRVGRGGALGPTVLVPLLPPFTHDPSTALVLFPSSSSSAAVTTTAVAFSSPSTACVNGDLSDSKRSSAITTETVNNTPTTSIITTTMTKMSSSSSNSNGNSNGDSSYKRYRHFALSLSHISLVTQTIKCMWTPYLTCTCLYATPALDTCAMMCCVVCAVMEWLI